MSPQLSQPERKITEQDAEAIARHAADMFVSRLCDEKTVDAILDVWTKQFDRSVGRSIRRVLWTVLTVVGTIIAIKMNAIIDYFRRGG